jgi:hypothetical protein
VGCRAQRHLRHAAREEALAEAVATTFVAYRRLIELNRPDIIYGTPLAHYAVLHARGDRHVGGRLHTRDALSRAAQRRHGFRVHISRLPTNRSFQLRTKTSGSMPVLRQRLLKTTRGGEFGGGGIAVSGVTDDCLFRRKRLLASPPARALLCSSTRH